MQPFLDSDMQSRYFEFGEDTIVRADQYGFSLSDLQDLGLRLRLQVYPTHIRPSGAIRMAFLPNAYDRDQLDGTYPTIICK